MDGGTKVTAAAQGRGQGVKTTIKKSNNKPSLPWARQANVDGALEEAKRQQREREEEDEFQPYYTSLLLSYTAAKLTSESESGLEQVLFNNEQAQAQLTDQQYNNYLLAFALQYEMFADMINFKEPGFEKLLVGETEMMEEEGTTNDVEMYGGGDEGGLKNFAYVYDDTLIFNEGKKLGQLIEFGPNSKETEQKRAELKKYVEKIKTGASTAIMTDTQSVQQPSGFNHLLGHIPGLQQVFSEVPSGSYGGKRKTKKKLIRKLIKGKKSLKERKLLKQKKSLKVRKLNKLKKTKKNNSKS